MMARGIERKPIYLDDEDREQFLKVLANVVRRHRWECLAYCLMGNHYHLVVRTPLPNLSRGMCLVNGGYASWVNGRYARVGHLFQGRFRSVLIRSSEHLRIVVKYVLRNPVAAGLCAHPEDWTWSSYRATLAHDPRGLVAAPATVAWFGEGESGRERFASFVGDDIAPDVDVLADVAEFPSEAGSARPRPHLEELLALNPGAGGIALAHGQHGYSFTEIARALGGSSSAVGRILVAHEAQEMLTAATWPRAT